YRMGVELRPADVDEEQSEWDRQRGPQRPQNDRRLVADERALQVRHPADVGHRSGRSGLPEAVREQLFDRLLAGIVDLARAGACEVRMGDLRHALRLPARSLPAEPGFLLFIEDVQRFVAQLR